MLFDTSKPTTGYAVFPDFSCMSLSCGRRWDILILPEPLFSLLPDGPIGTETGHIPVRDGDRFLPSITNVFLEQIFNYTPTKSFQGLSPLESMRWTEATEKTFQISRSSSSLSCTYTAGSRVRSWGCARSWFPPSPITLRLCELSPDS